MNSLSEQNILLTISGAFQSSPERQLKIQRLLVEVKKIQKSLFDVPNYRCLVQTFLTIPWKEFLDEWMWWELATHWYVYSKMWKFEEVSHHGLFQDPALRQLYTNQREMLLRKEYLGFCGENPGDMEKVIEAIVFLCRYQNFRAYDHAYVFRNFPPELSRGYTLIQHMPLDGRLKLWRSISFQRCERPEKSSNRRETLS